MYIFYHTHVEETPQQKKNQKSSQFDHYKPSNSTQTLALKLTVSKYEKAWV